MNIMKTKIFHKMKYDIKGHPRSYKTASKPKFLFTDKIWMNANIMKTHFFHKIIYDLKYHFYVMEKFSDLISTLTYVLMENFCPCFKCVWNNILWKFTHKFTGRKFTFKKGYFVLNAGFKISDIRKKLWI